MDIIDEFQAKPPHKFNFIKSKPKTRLASLAYYFLLLKRQYRRIIWFALALLTGIFAFLIPTGAAQEIPYVVTILSSIAFTVLLGLSISGYRSINDFIKSSSKKDWRSVAAAYMLIPGMVFSVVVFFYISVPHGNDSMSLLYDSIELNSDNSKNLSVNENCITHNDFLGNILTVKKSEILECIE